MKSGNTFTKIKDKSMDREIKNNKSLENSLNIAMRFSELESQLFDEKNKNKELNEKVKQLEKELDNEKKIVKVLKDRINSSNITQLQILLDLKDKEIERLKKNNDQYNNLKPGEKIYSVNFVSIDQKIGNYSITCKNTDIFVKLEEQLYEDNPEYKDKETYFIKNGNKIKRFKSLDENKIVKNDILMLLIYDK